MPKLTVDISGEIVYTDSSETTSGNVLASIPVVFCCHTTTAYFDTKRSTEGAPTGGLPQVMQSFPDDLLYCVLCFKPQEPQVPEKNYSDNTNWVLLYSVKQDAYHVETLDEYKGKPANGYVILSHHKTIEEAFDEAHRLRNR